MQSILHGTPKGAGSFLKASGSINIVRLAAL